MNFENVAYAENVKKMKIQMKRLKKYRLGLKSDSFWPEDSSLLFSTIVTRKIFSTFFLFSHLKMGHFKTINFMPNNFLDQTRTKTLQLHFSTKIEKIQTNFVLFSANLRIYFLLFTIKVII